MTSQQHPVPASRAKDKVLTVLGPIEPGRVGVCMTHEHLLIDFQCVLEEPTEASQRKLMEEKVSLENLWWVRHYWNSNKDNLQMLDVDTAIEEAREYSLAGGSTIVDVTSIGLARDPIALAQISRATGLNVVMGGGYYVHLTHSDHLRNRASVDEVAEGIIRDVEIGVGETGIRTGIIGEIGCSWPWEESEQKTLEAAVIAQRETGAPLLIHPGRDDHAPIELLNAVDKWGGDFSHTVMGHIERTIFDRGALDEVADSGVFMNYDLWGHESTYYPMRPDTYMPSDQHRIEQVEHLIAGGHAPQLLLAHDICSKHRLKRYGGHGWDHIVARVVPRMRARGITQETISLMLVDNPTRMLTFS